MGRDVSRACLPEGVLLCMRPQDSQVLEARWATASTQWAEVTEY
jgi:hypothetical protein